MSCCTPLDHSCDPFQADSSIIPITSPKPYNQFYIEIHCQFTYPPAHLAEEDYLPVDDMQSVTHVSPFWVPYDRLLRNNTSWSTISNMLSSARVPLDIQPSMIHRIYDCANSIAGAAHNAGRKVVPMTVLIDVVDCGQDGADALAGWVPVPAAESSVEALEKVKVEDSGSMKCVICLEELSVGCEATRMPCSHVYHGDCIVNWLRVGNFCPLCRFQMPT